MDRYGAIEIPVQAPADGEEIGDPAVTLIARYLKTVLNVEGGAAWRTVAPVTTGLTTVPAGLASPVVKMASCHNPVEEVFDEKQLPGLYLWRDGGGERFWLAEDVRLAPDTWRVLWVFRPAQQQARRLRQSFVNAIGKIIDVAIETQRHPSFVDTGDPDPTADTTAAAPTAFKLSVASSTSAVTYSGAALDGAIGTTAFAPAQLPTVTVAGDAGSGTVEFHGIGDDGLDRVSRVELDGVGTFTGDFTLAQLTHIEVPAQPTTTATQTFGLAGFVGLGTNVFTRGRFWKLDVQKWGEKSIVIETDAEARTYEGIEIILTVEETWHRDTSSLEGSEAQPQFTFTGDNAGLRETALYD